MGISKNFPVANLPRVVPGQQVTQTVYTDQGFTAGDYVYSYANGKVGPSPILTTALPGGPIYNVIGGANGGSWGSGTIASTAIISPTAAGATYTLTYPTTTYASSYLALTSRTVSPSTSFSPCIAALTNGNVVIVYVKATNEVVFRIVNQAGAIVKADTSVGTSTAAGAVYSTDNYGACVCALNSGGFIICWPGANVYPHAAKYDAAGNVVIADTLLMSTPYYNLVCAADSSDNLFLLATLYLNGNQYSNLYRFNTSFTQTAYTGAGNFGYYSYYTQPKLTVTKGGNVLWAMSCTNQYVYWGLYNNALTSSVYSNNTYMAASYTQVYVCPGPTNGGFVAHGYSGSYLRVMAVSDAGVNTANISYSTPYSTNYGIAIAPYFGNYSTHVYDATANNAVVYFYDSSYPAYVRSFVCQSNGVYDAAVYTDVVPYNTMLGFQASGYGAANYVLQFNGTTHDIGMIGSYNLSGSGTAALPASSYTTVNNGYVLLGVAATTAAAGSYGEVIINGEATLSSSYGTSSTPYAFNYNPLNLTGVFGNTGYVVNRVVTLQGLE